MSKIDSRSRYLALILRHKPEEAGVTVEDHGWVSIDQLIRNTDFTRAELVEIVDTDKKGRYSISKDGGKIRANQGHSIPVNMLFLGYSPTGALYHGTAKRFIASIMREGIQKMGRQYVHLSLSYEQAVNVGSRHGEPVVLYVDATKMLEDGYGFHISDNGVVLIDWVPPEYLTVMEENSGSR